jgi:hypothetical protein
MTVKFGGYFVLLRIRPCFLEGLMNREIMLLLAIIMIVHFKIWMEEI